MLTLFELSGEHATLPIAEIRGVVESEGIKSEEIYHNRIAIFEIKDGIKKFDRLAMSHSINELIAEGNEIDKAIKDMELEGDFKIEFINFDKKYSSSYIKNKYGREIEKRTGCKVNLKNPHNIIKIFSHGKLYLTKEIYKIDRHQFEARRNKPFELPITMHPRLARAIVNIARVKKGDTIVDPFCGTGTILIEAGLMGAKIIGIEAKKWIAEGCKKNLKFFGLNGKIYAKDMRNVDIKANAVITDFPYGRASYVGEEIKKLYDEAFKKIDNWIENGYIMAGIGNKNLIEIGKKYFELIEIHPCRVHKSLIRFFCLFMKN